MDALSIHPYRDVPEGVEYELAGLKEALGRFNGGQQKPIWATDIGNFPSSTKHGSDRSVGLGGRKRLGIESPTLFRFIAPVS